MKRSYDQRICLRSKKREKEAFKYYFKKLKAMARTHLETIQSLKEVIQGSMKEKEEDESL